MSETTINFGPQWIRQLSHGDSVSTPPPTPTCTGPLAKYKLAEYRYGKEEILTLFQPVNHPPDALMRFPEITLETAKQPLSLQPLTEQDQRLLSQGVNSQAALRTSGRGGGPAGANEGSRAGGQPDRGGHSDRGFDRGPGRGGHTRGGHGDRGRGRSAGRGFLRDTDDTGRQQLGADRRVVHHQPHHGADRDDDWRQRLDNNRRHRQHSDGAAEDGLSSSVGNTGGNSHMDWRRGPPRARGGGQVGGQTGWRQRNTSWGNNRFTRRDHDENNLPEWSTADDDESGGFFDSSGNFRQRGANFQQYNRGESGRRYGGSQSGVGGSEEFQHEDEYEEDWDTELAAARESSWEPETDTRSKDDEDEEEEEETLEDDQVALVQGTRGGALHEQMDAAAEHLVNNLVDEFAVASVSSGSRSPTGGSGSAVAPPPNEERDLESAISAAPVYTKRSWYYKDPHDRVQGPFESKDMDNWYAAGFFKPPLPLRRDCDEVFSQLGAYLDMYGNRIPFRRGDTASPPPILMQPQQQQQQQQPSQQQQQAAEIHAQLMQILPNTFTPEQIRLLQQQAGGSVAPAALIAQLLQQVAPVGETKHSPEPVAEPAAPNVWRQRSQEMEEQERKRVAIEEEQQRKQREEELREREEAVRRQAEEFAREKKKMEQEAAELRRIQEEERRKRESLEREAEEQRRKVVEERQRAEEERRRREREEAERKRLEKEAAERKRRQQEADAQAVAAERFRREEQAAVEEMRKAEAERQRRMQEEHLSKQGQNAGGGWTAPSETTTSASEPATTAQVAAPVMATPLVDIQRAQAEIANREAAEKNAKDDKERQEKAAAAAQQNWSGWRSPTSPGNSKPITEIMAEQEKQARRDEQRVREQMGKQAPSSGGMGAGGSWMTGNNWAGKVQKGLPPSTAPNRSGSNAAPAMSRPPPPGGSIWALDSFVSAGPGGAAAGKPNSHFPSLQTARKPAASSQGVTGAGAGAAGRGGQKSQQNTRGGQKAVRAPSGEGAQKDEAAVARALEAGRAASCQDELTGWCQEQLKGIPDATEVDIPTLVELLRELESPFEVEDYIIQYLGESKRTVQFAKDFLEKRRGFREDAVKKHQQTREAALAHHSHQQSTASSGGGSLSGTKTSGSSKNNNKKKKGKKMQKVNENLLGFSCGADPNRVNMGEIETAE